MDSTSTKATPTDATYKGRTADQWRAAAAEQQAARNESFDRCDTDGFLSQWASGCMAAEYHACARLAERNGLTDTRALFNLDGTVASTHPGANQYGDYWVLNDEAAERYGRRFYRPSEARKAVTRNANNRKKGFTVGTIRVAGYVQLVGEVTLHAATLPVVEDLRNGTFDIIAVDDDTNDYT